MTAGLSWEYLAQFGEIVVCDFPYKRWEFEMPDGQRLQYWGFVGYGLVQYRDPQSLVRAINGCDRKKAGPFGPRTLRVDAATREFDVWKCWERFVKAPDLTRTNSPRISLYPKEDSAVWRECEDGFWGNLPEDWPHNEGTTASVCARVAREALDNKKRRREEEVDSVFLRPG